MTLKTSPTGPAIANLEVADTLWTRTRGLLGRADLAADAGLWIKPCNSVHTFFMRFAIDLVFLDAELKVKKVYRDVRPGRLTWPAWGARSVIEFKAGFLSETPLNPGEQLYVDHPLS